MQTILARASVGLGTIAALLVFTPFFKTPPILIGLFASVGMITGLFSKKEGGYVSVVGVVLSVGSLLYLVYLFIGLGG